MSLKKHKSLRGFTLVEMVIVLALLGLLGLAALTTYFNVTGNFQFLNTFRSISSTFRMARSYAITNTTVKIAGTDTLPERYGVHITSQLPDRYEIILFADTGTLPLEFDKNDVKINSKSYNVGMDDYSIIALDSAINPNKLSFPLTFFYEKKTGNPIFFQYNATDDKNELLPKKNIKYVALELSQNIKSPMKKYLIVYSISGLPEEFKKIP